MDSFTVAKCLLSKLNIENPHIIDGGACVGYTIIEFLKHFPGAIIYAFEPHPDAYDRIVKLFASNKNVKTYNELLGEKDEPMKFHIMRDIGTGSVLLPGSVVKQYHKSKMDIIKTIDIDCTTIDTCFSNIDLIKLDVHGAELPTLKSSVNVLPNVKIVITEMIFYEAFIGQAPFYELSSFLYQQGFELFSIFDLAYHPVSSRLGGGNALFTNKKFITAI